MSDKTRSYEVRNTDMLESHPPRLVIATSQAAAIRHVSKPLVATVADGKRVSELLDKGVKVEHA